MGRGLSEQQKTAVRRIGDELIRKQRGRDEADAESRRYIGLFGARCLAYIRTESGWASWARTLRRLEERDLIVRRGYDGDWLTPSGWALYQQLTGTDVPTELTGSP
jgi:hypothetical protein